MPGLKIVYAHTTASMTSSSATVLALNDDREYALFVNDGSATVYIKVGATAVANQGIRINANGGSYEMSRALGNLSDVAVNGITASGTATLLVVEGV